MNLYAYICYIRNYSFLNCSACKNHPGTFKKKEDSDSAVQR